MLWSFYNISFQWSLNEFIFLNGRLHGHGTDESDINEAVHYVKIWFNNQFDKHNIGIISEGFERPLCEKEIYSILLRLMLDFIPGNHSIKTRDFYFHQMNTLDIFAINRNLTFLGYVYKFDMTGFKSSTMWYPMRIDPTTDKGIGFPWALKKNMTHFSYHFCRNRPLSSVISVILCCFDWRQWPILETSALRTPDRKRIEISVHIVFKKNNALRRQLSSTIRQFQKNSR